MLRVTKYTIKAHTRVGIYLFGRPGGDGVVCTRARARTPEERYPTYIPQYAVLISCDIKSLI